MTKWKIVPAEEPTPEMRAVICNAGCIYLSEDELYVALLEATPPPPKLSDERLFHYAAEIRKALEPDPIGATINIVALLRAVEREILGGGECTS